MEHTFPGFRSVGWTMTTANHSAIFPQSSEGDGRSVRAGATRVGKWTYTPVSTDWAPNESATLHREGREVDLHYSSSVFEDFLEAMSAIENDFGRRFQEAASVEPSVGEHSGRNSLV
ncbi:hypothetical protein [Streptomyces sp. KS 21]|uniref:hypothetical protein n=1 Tax=Streptomyces sp. KS 21 TaxID=2485150 RepID=UPI00106447C8|nr:hypothetical protein [Streptomyces sp. KS 21]